ncbi:TPA: adenine phosphoribosyltransferase [Candidatus Galligastranaerophilus intestinigallinarum]|nr:adenine phosphoribosyltransferase [Candidatus Galligastranaerophilus intestinigallinarum]
MDYIKNAIRDVPDFPKKGILFRDITTAIKDKDVMKRMIDEIVEAFKDEKIDYVAGIESRGFIFGMPVAYSLGCGFVPIRKPNKLPAETYSVEYQLEYGTDKIEMHKDAIEKGKRVLIIDDLLATGGTAAAACELVKKAGVLAGLAFVIELTDLKGREKLPKDVKILSLAKY